MKEPNIITFEQLTCAVCLFILDKNACSYLHTAFLVSCNDVWRQLSYAFFVRMASAVRIFLF